MRKVITSFLSDGIAIKQAMLSDDDLLSQIEAAAGLFIECRNRGGTVYSCGNGGSTCDAMHLTEELVARYKRERPGIRAMHFCDASAMTCWSNDYEYEGTFERYAETFCTERDLFVGITTSGNSANIIRAAKVAKQKGSKVIGFLGKGGGKLASLCDVPLIVPSDQTDRIQEIHVLFLHLMCEIVEGTTK